MQPDVQLSAMSSTLPSTQLSTQAETQTFTTQPSTQAEAQNFTFQHSSEPPHQEELPDLEDIPPEDQTGIVQDPNPNRQSEVTHPSATVEPVPTIPEPEAPRSSPPHSVAQEDQVYIVDAIPIKISFLYLFESYYDKKRNLAQKEENFLVLNLLLFWILLRYIHRVIVIDL